MTTNNINKFVRGSVHLKPWNLIKNPSDIVNSYVQWLYKQAPHHFRNDSEKPRIATPNIGSQFRTSIPSAARYTFPIVNKPKSKLRPTGYRSPPMTTKNSFVAGPPKKLVKSPNLKIYNTRRFTSSASSSNASFCRKSYEERRKSMYKPANGMQFRTFTAMAAADFSNNSKYIPPARLYNELNSQLKTNAICNDLMLMPVDKTTKKIIHVVRAKPPPPEPAKPTKRDTLATSIKGWLPFTLHMSKFTALPVITKPPVVKKEVPKKSPLSFGSMSVRQMTHGSKVRPLHTNASQQVSNQRAGVNTGSYYLQRKVTSRVDPTKFKECVPLVCRSRTARSVSRPLSQVRKF